MNKKKLLKLLSEDLRLFLDEMVLKWGDEFPDMDEIYLMRSQFSRIDKLYRNGLINFSESQLQLNKITSNCIRLVNLFEPKNKNAVEIPTEKKVEIPTTKKIKPKPKSAKRIYTNSEIQLLLTERLKAFPTSELEFFLDKDYSKEVFNLNFPLLVRTQSNSPIERKRELVKDNKNNRWTWRYEFEKGNYIYAICTQWFRWNDEYVEAWLEKNEQI